MSCQLPADCLNEIFRRLNDRRSLHSCLLVNRLWCQVSVQILWKTFLNFNTLIACLPDESKEILRNNEIIISTPTPNPPTFDYVSFVRRLSIDKISVEIHKIMPYSFHNHRRILAQELFKAFTSIKRLIFHTKSADYLAVTLARNTSLLEGLVTLDCSSDLNKLFTNLDGCRNLRSLIVKTKGHISGALGNLISAQQHLEHLEFRGTNDLRILIPSIKEVSDTLTILKFDVPTVLWEPLTFLSGMNLQVLILVFEDGENFRNFEDVTLPQLRVLKLQDRCPSRECMIRFLEKNGGNLEVLSINLVDCLSSSDIIILCPNIKLLNDRPISYYFCNIKRIVLKFNK